MVKRPFFFYGWIIVGIASITMVLAYGIRHSFAIFFPSILDEFGWGRGNTALMFSLNLLVYGLLGPFTGNLADRWKPRRLALIGFSILALATAGNAFAQKLWHFYLFFGFLAPLGTSFLGWPLLGPALTNWFSKRRGMALGLGQMGGGLSFVYGMFAELVISQLGWRYAYLVLAGALVVILLPLYLRFFSYRPEDKGLKAYGAEEALVNNNLRGEEAAGKIQPNRDWTLSQAARTYQLWLLVFSSSLYWGFGSYQVLVHQVKFAEDVGYSGMFAASIFALYGIFMAVGQFSGFISDWIGRELTVTLASSMAIVALVALLSVKDTSQPWLLYVYAIFFGYGAGVYSPTLVAGAADIFYGKHFGAIAGLLLTGMGIGGVIGPWLGGYIYDISGSYTGAFALCIIAFALSCLAFWIAAPRKPTRLVS